ncbi:uncharacterized protein FFUJ_01808 [Fusarium fujikuroi IMI 58289]|uniref:Uncharacterized protein n=1 Tax=Gibberella fujikuroi (strain CBS 195.34 / IMI 58289 / NRRL A-6831) TaxID=1279085 RepID=S0DMC3_GIBF5|nr:uncharacterized protein FFUJ_01808 [Fusarium fujikuroi IMI 58289]KLP16311.1 uncharacterized protein LW94_11606 [Fusarium fujikuroi]CCT61708.1 uncharacterized protein FFUJ_01808 [Fusarium fujikuroi IMI 58289]SCO12224.1 uncharacterized protein FFM5_10234 [Fusarium fujikuroi]
MPSQSAGGTDDLDLSPDEPKVVGPYEPDIATTIQGERMNLDAPGRRRFGQCYLWSTSDGPKKGSYKVEDDGPQKRLCPCLPIESELMPHGKADQYPEVGLLIGEEPGKYKPTGLSRNKGRQSEQAARGVSERKSKCNASIYPDQRVHPTAGKVTRSLSSTDRLYSRQYNDSGEAAFFTTKGTNHSPMKLYQAWLPSSRKPASPTHTDLNKRVAQAARRVLRTEKIDNPPMPASLLRSRLFYFLENCQLQIKPDDDDINTKVRAIFTLTQAEDGEEEPSANKELSDWLVAVCEYLRMIQYSAGAYADLVTEKHGLVLSNSINNAMTQLNNATGVNAFRAGLEHLASSSHASLLASNQACLSRQLDFAIDGSDRGFSD